MMPFDSQDIFDCQNIFNMVQIMLQVVDILDVFVAGGGCLSISCCRWWAQL